MGLCVIHWWLFLQVGSLFLSRETFRRTIATCYPVEEERRGGGEAGRVERRVALERAGRVDGHAGDADAGEQVERRRGRGRRRQPRHVVPFQAGGARDVDGRRAADQQTRRGHAHGDRLAQRRLFGLVLARAVLLLERVVDVAQRRRHLGVA